MSLTLKTDIQARRKEKAARRGISCLSHVYSNGHYRIYSRFDILTSDEGTDKTKYDLTISRNIHYSLLKGCKTVLWEPPFQAFKHHLTLQSRSVERVATGTKSWGPIWWSHMPCCTAADEAQQHLCGAPPGPRVKSIWVFLTHLSWSAGESNQAVLMHEEQLENRK